MLDDDIKLNDTCKRNQHFCMSKVISNPIQSYCIIITYKHLPNNTL